MEFKGEAMTSKSIILDIKSALKQFGEYSYYDKGPSEVMDMDSYYREFKSMTPGDTEKILLEVLKNKHGELFVSDVLGNLQDMPEEWFSELLSNDTLADLL